MLLYHKKTKTAILLYRNCGWILFFWTLLPAPVYPSRRLGISSPREAWRISSRAAHRPCISSRHSRAYPFLRFDAIRAQPVISRRDIQHFALMIYNFYEIDDMQGLRLDFIAKDIGLQGKFSSLQAFLFLAIKYKSFTLYPFRSIYGVSLNYWSIKNPWLLLFFVL